MSFKACVQPFGIPISTTKNNFYSAASNQLELLKAIQLQMQLLTGNEYLGAAQGKRVCHIDIARPNFILALQEYATSIDHDNLEEIYKGNQQTRFNHLIEIRSNVGLYLPTFFFFPLHISISNHALPIFVGSAPKLYRELQEIKLHLKPEGQINLSPIGETFHAGEEELEDYEADHEGLRSFWPIFAYTIFESLVKKSLEHKLPFFIFS